MADESGSDDDSAATEDSYSPSRPFITHLDYADGSPVEYTPLHLGELPQFGPNFRLPAGIEPSPTALCEVFFPDTLLNDMVTATDDYARRRLSLRAFKSVSKSDLLEFFAAIYYMGVIRLPAKEDYFRGFDGSCIWRPHPAIHIKRHKFRYLWRNFHLVPDSVEQEEEDPYDSADDEEAEPDGSSVESEPSLSEEEEGSDDDDVPLTTLFGVREGGEDAEEEEAPAEEEEEAPPFEEVDNAAPPPPQPPVGADEVWFAKVSVLLDHVTETSQCLCQHPGYALAIDEMMKRFKGRSRKTHRMKQKPIKEGYKFFAVCCSTSGYVLDFFPDGRGDKNTILASVTRLIDSIPKRHQKKYVLAMDNYFTTPKVMVASREQNVAVIGTARRQPGWPPSELANVDDKRFNTLYLMNDRCNFLVG